MEKENIIFFDGVCNLCNGFIDYVIKRDKKKSIFYAALQSETAKSKLKKHIELKENTDYTTIYYFTNNKLYSKSSAILNIFLELSTTHAFLARVLFVIPKFIRDAIYTFIAKNRYLFFGKKSTCRLPSLEERNQFL
ncbi:DUF393 domain-containing protein [Tamlana agarivorans]|uniref:DUF393 domain-containing protein n=1 Tax=Pseudotamlana agarivorans TaxID=481183 RepID=A0ACC5UA08_9FLAO|nr:DCC1-like thiol-disulfide oxidoreductase family protein [Tamlana agarivorans]MBU2951162.1 DUF393 domain-containing protein [Tamlana agarivorans]